MISTDLIRVIIAAHVSTREQQIAVITGPNAAPYDVANDFEIEINTFPSWFLPRKRTPNEISFGNGNRIIFVNHPSKLKGRTLDLIYVPEDMQTTTAAFLPHMFSRMYHY